MAVRLGSEADRVRDGEAAGLPGRKSFPGTSLPTGAPSRTGPPLPLSPPSPKSFAILDAGGFGGHPEDMLPHSCVCGLTPGLTDASRQAARPDAERDGWSGGIVLAPGQNRPERNPALRPGSAALASRANRDAGCNAAVRPHGRMRDRPRACSPLRHAKPSMGGRQADLEP